MLALGISRNARDEPVKTEDGWRRAYKFRDRLMAEVVRLELDPLGEELKVIEAVYIR